MVSDHLALGGSGATSGGRVFSIWEGIGKIRNILIYRTGPKEQNTLVSALRGTRYKSRHLSNLSRIKFE